MNWGVYKFPWGTAVKNEETGEWTNVFASQTGQEIVVEGLDVQLNDDGVIFKQQGIG